MFLTSSLASNGGAVRAWTVQVVEKVSTRLGQTLVVIYCSTLQLDNREQSIREQSGREAVA